MHYYCSVPLQQTSGAASRLQVCVQKHVSRRRLQSHPSHWLDTFTKIIHSFTFLLLSFTLDRTALEEDALETPLRAPPDFKSSFRLVLDGRLRKDSVSVWPTLTFRNADNAIILKLELDAGAGKLRRIMPPSSVSNFLAPIHPNFFEKSNN